MRGEGTIELTGDHVYSAKATIAAAKVSDYTGLIRRRLARSCHGWPHRRLNGPATAKPGRTLAGSISMEPALKAGKRQAWHPFTAEVDAEYSPGNMFFRQAHLANEHASLNGFVTFSSRLYADPGACL